MIRKVVDEDIDFLNLFLTNFDIDFTKHYNLTNYINNNIYNVLVYINGDNNIIGFFIFVLSK